MKKHKAKRAPQTKKAATKRTTFGPKPFGLADGFTIRLFADQEEKISAIARQQNAERSEVIRFLIDQGLPGRAPKRLHVLRSVAF